MKAERNRGQGGAFALVEKASNVTIGANAEIRANVVTPGSTGGVMTASGKSRIVLGRYVHVYVQHVCVVNGLLFLDCLVNKGVHFHPWMA